MELFKQKRTAVLCCILLTVLALLLGSHRSLAAKRQQALDVYLVGDETGISVAANLNSIAGYADELLKSAAGSLGEGDAAYDALRTACRTLRDAAPQDVAAQRQGLNAVLDAAAALQAALQSRTDVPEETLRAVRRGTVDIISMKDQIGHSGYNTAAAQFNRLLQKFPMGLLGGLTGIRPLALF